MEKMLQLTLALALSFSATCATAKTQMLEDCNQLQAPKTVLLVHATWCHCCESYLPRYEAVSNRPEMKEYSFYTIKNNYLQKVCGMRLSGVPVTLTHNMSKVLEGPVSEEELMRFIKGK